MNYPTIDELWKVVKNKKREMMVVLPCFPIVFYNLD